jgi:DNA primase
VRDFFRARILFPIFDAQGDPVGFGGRLLPGATGPKYLNPGTTALYDKSKVLYGLNWAKTEAVTRGEVVVCEGYTDVIGFHQAGVARAVATCGTALTEDHVKLLTRFAKRVLLAFDADAAGRAAAERFHTWEQRYGIDVGVVSLPGGVDPADLAQRDPAALRDAVEHAVPFLSFRLDRLFADANLTTPEGRARAAQAALTVVEGHPDPLVREQYLLDVATRCRVEVASLDRLAAEARSAPVEGRTAGGAVGRRSADAPPPFPGGGPGGRRLPIDSRLARAGDGMRSGGGGASRSGGAVKVDRRPRIHPHNHERTALRLAADRPDLVVEWFDPVLFAEPLYRQAAVQLADAGTLAVALDTADAPVADILRQVAAEESDAQPEEVFLRLAHEAAVREVRMIQQATRGSIGPETKAAYVALTGWQGTLVDYERPEDERLQAGTELLTWLLDQAEERG